MYKCDKNQVPYYNVIFFKKWNFWEFWAIYITLRTLDKLNYYYFHEWKKLNILNAYIKIGAKLFHLTWKKKGNLKQVVRKKKIKWIWIFRSEYLVFLKGYPNHVWPLCNWNNYMLVLDYVTTLSHMRKMKVLI
jgi:hypothetical protein